MARSTRGSTTSPACTAFFPEARARIFSTTVIPISHDPLFSELFHFISRVAQLLEQLSGMRSQARRRTLHRRRRLLELRGRVEQPQLPDPIRMNRPNGLPVRNLRCTESSFQAQDLARGNPACIQRINPVCGG